MAWQPQEEPLRQLAQCLRDSLSGHDPNARKNAGEVSLLLLHTLSPYCADRDDCIDAQVRPNFTRYRQVPRIHLLQQPAPVQRQHGCCAILPSKSCRSRHAQERRKDHLQIDSRLDQGLHTIRDTYGTVGFYLTNTGLCRKCHNGDCATGHHHGMASDSVRAGRYG